jgi:glucose-1-phosphate cytidylyltransferase
MKVVILAGGLGTRLSEETHLKPKPMVEIGDRPILRHIMDIYSRYEYKEFIVALGYKGEVIKDYFLNYYYMSNDLSVHVADNKVEVHGGEFEDWIVHLIDTGLGTGTGGRIKRLASWLAGETFMLTYGDGLANIDIGALLDFHQGHGKLVTITAVRPAARFGGLEFNGDCVTRFIEKPQIGEGWINGGFFIMEPGVLDYIHDNTTMFEQEPLEKLVADGELMAYRHNDFWQCMDTRRDKDFLEKLWERRDIPWKT